MILVLGGCAFFDQRRAAQIDQADVAAGAEATSSGDLPGLRSDSNDDDRLTRLELRTELFAFADRYVEGTAEFSDWAGSTADPDNRAGYQGVKVIYSSSAISVVTLPEPVHALRDLIVMLRLQQGVWRDGGPEWVSAEVAARYHKGLVQAERQLLVLANRVMPASAIDELLDMTDEWVARNPDRRYVAYVRFSNLGNESRRRRFDDEINSKGLLAPVSKAAAELEEIRSASERALFLMNRLPLLMEWQSELFMLNTLEMPAVATFFEDTRRFADATAEFGDDLRVAVDDMGVILAEERSAAILQLASEFRRERVELLREMERSAQGLLPLTDSLSNLTANLRDTAQIIGELTDAGTETEMDLVQVEEVIEDVTVMTETTLALVDALRSLMGMEIAGQPLMQIDDLLETHVRRIFLYVAILILLAGAVAVAVVLVAKAPRRTRR
jgi:hypothetical protein